MISRKQLYGRKSTKFRLRCDLLRQRKGGYTQLCHDFTQARTGVRTCHLLPGQPPTHGGDNHTDE